MLSNTKETIQFTKRDWEVLNFLWKWKLCTTRGLAELYFSGSGRAAYNRLRSLKQEGFIKHVGLKEEQDGFVWTLTQKGFYRILSSMQELEEEGFAPDYLNHDLYVMALHLGDWFLGAPAGVEYFSEQQIRRSYKSHFPSWVPKLIGRIPDGYLLVPGKKSNSIFAFEVEFSIKDIKKYGPITKAYAACDSISRAIWLVKNKKDAMWLANKFEELEPESCKMHNIVDATDFKKVGWQAPILFGLEQNETLKYCLCNAREYLMKWSVNPPETFQAPLLLDTSKCAFDSTSSNDFKTSDFSNSMASPPYSDSHTNLLQEPTSQPHNTDSNDNSNTFQKEENINE